MEQFDESGYICNCEYCKYYRDKTKPEPLINYIDWLTKAFDQDTDLIVIKRDSLDEC